MTDIAVLGGTGALGSGLARRWARAGHNIWIGSRDARKAQSAAILLCENLQCTNVAGADLETAAAQASIVVLAVPYASRAEMLEAVKPQCAGKIVIDTTVPLMPPRVGTVQLPELVRQLFRLNDRWVRVCASYLRFRM